MEKIEALSEDEHCIEEMTEVVGFQHMSGITSAGQMFGSCPKLETIYATSFSNAGEKNGDSSSMDITGFVENAGGVSVRDSANPRVMRP